MGQIWVREFIGGLDTRRMPETTSGGVLIKATDGHINRGGEFEKRPAFVKEYTLPEGATTGLAAGKSGIFVFGHLAPPAVPSGISYQRLQHPDGVTGLVRVLSYDLYAGKIYVVGEFEDGSRYHFYDGVRVPDWYDGRARAQFRVTGGGVTAAAAATGSFEVTGGTLNAGVNEFTDITIDGVSIISGTDIDHTGNNSTTASAIAAAITSHASSPDYTATAIGQTVIITASATGTAANGKTIVISVAGNATAGNIVNMSGGAAAATSTLADLTVDGVSILAAPVVWATSNSDTASDIAAAINSMTSSPDYSATAVGEVVNIVADAAGVDANGRVVTFALESGFTVTPEVGLVLADGSDPVPAASASGSFIVTGGTAGAANKVSSIVIDSVTITGGDILWTTSHAATATAIANAINSFISSPDYTASANAETVTITAVTTGAAINGESITVNVGGNVTVGSVQAMSGGTDAEATFVPGTYVKTIGSRMHSVSGANEHFSGIKAPTKWTTDTTGAGFIDMSTQASGSETLTGLAKYQQFVAVFAERVIQIWYFDSDPSLNEQKQVLNNTGTASPRSITQFGDNDLFYADESGLRSLKARDASNAAATTDIGVPVDTLIVERLAQLSDEDREKVIGLIEPRDGRFWLIILDQIFVFSFFSGAKISAWSTYTPSTKIDEELVEFEVDDAVVFGRKVYVRADDDIYVFGGLGADLVYDETEAEAWLPYLDGDSPTRKKALVGVDAAVDGLWEVRMGMNINDLDASDLMNRVSETTYNLEKLAGEGRATHFGLRFKTIGEGAAKLGAAVIHFDSDEDED
jgi:hypothetical protein